MSDDRPNEQFKDSSSSIAGMVRQMYNALIQEGFSEAESMELTKTWMMALFGKGVKQ
jgi:cytochrome c-type biogenesis protein CcmH/NrfF